MQDIRLHLEDSRRDGIVDWAQAAGLIPHRLYMDGNSVGQI